MGGTRPMGTSRLGPLAGSSRSGTPSGASNGNRASGSTSQGQPQQSQQQQQQGGLMKQNLLDKDRKMAEYSVSRAFNSLAAQVQRRVYETGKLIVYHLSMETVTRR